MSAVAEEGVTAEQEAQELADRADNIKIAVEAAEGERQRRMSEGNMADVQADLVKQSNIEAAKKSCGRRASCPRCRGGKDYRNERSLPGR